MSVVFLLIFYYFLLVTVISVNFLLIFCYLSAKWSVNELLIAKKRFNVPRMGRLNLISERVNFLNLVVLRLFSGSILIPVQGGQGILISDHIFGLRTLWSQTSNDLCS